MVVSPRKKSSHVECGFLVPIRGDAALSDGSVHAPEQWEWLRAEIWSQFGGVTESPGLHVGFYQNPDTEEMVTDESRRFTVAVQEHEVDNLRDLMREACVMFCQKCIYLSIAGRVEFIERSND
ncbi:MAG: hypothetical protein DWQ29_22205 [Planctomycetota bacterium]|nr:MAG: hypothetical protein DWQ29_22205 [Planctomycetota bacterium]